MKRLKGLKTVLAAVLIALAACALFGCAEDPASPSVPSEPSVPSSPSAPSEPSDPSNPSESDDPDAIKQFKGITFANKAVTYNGVDQRLEIGGNLPKGATVTYENNVGKNVGEYAATATITCDGYETKTLTATLKINKAQFGSSITFNDKTVTYDGNEQSIVVGGTLPDGTSVNYVNNKGTNADDYAASVTLTNPNYETKTLTATLKINKAQFDASVTLQGLTVDYDGMGHTVSLTNASNLPEGTSITYANHEGTDAGTYSATATLKKANYEDKTLSATLKINEIEFANKANVAFQKLRILFGDGTNARTVSINKSESDFPDGTTITYANNSKVEEGRYTATVTVSHKNYIDISLSCSWRIISIEEIVNRLTEVLTSKPSIIGFLPAAFSQSSKCTATGNLTAVPTYNFATGFVDVDDINQHFIGKQLNAVYDMIESAEAVFAACDSVNTYSAGVMSAISGYLTSFAGVEDQTFEFTINPSGFTKAKFVMSGEEVGVLLGNEYVNAELYYDFETQTRAGRYQVKAGSLAGGVVQYTSGEDELTLTYAADVAKAACAVKQIVLVKENDVVAGYMYEYEGTLSGTQEDTTEVADDDPKKEGYGMRSVAAIRSDSSTTVIVSNKRETDDMPMYGYEEVYDSSTGKFIGGEIAEHVNLSVSGYTINREFDTFWFNLYDVTNFVDNVKAENAINGMNANTVYVNNSTVAIHSKWLINATFLTNVDPSRRSDIEMKDVYYFVKETTDGKTEYKRVKSSIPMLFVQNAQCKDKSGLSTVNSTCVEKFADDWYDKNKDSGAKDTSAVLPSTIPITANFTAMKNLFTTVCDAVSYASIKATIGQPNSFFTDSTTGD